MKNKEIKQPENNLENEQRILMHIGHYFLSRELETKTEDEAFIYTHNLLRTINITDIKTVDKNTFEITMCRPGIFIGSRGVTIYTIEKDLGISIKIKENKLAPLVYPLDYRNY